MSRLHTFYWAVVFFSAVACARALADGPVDNQTNQVRRVPPPGVVIPEAQRQELTSGVENLGKEIDLLRGDLVKQPALLARLPDVQIFHKAVQWALQYDEFFRTNEVDAARSQLAEAHVRLEALKNRQAPWTKTNGLVVRGYLSRIDHSIQPYGLVIPPSWTPHSGRRWRLDFWFHGRGEQLSELSFLADRMKNPGEFTPPDAFVLHLYGRYCNGSRFAGETDFWEALEDVRAQYPIDEDRLVVRGFSLGGAACWHFTTHYASRWAAAAPGAGFSETADFLKVFQKESLTPSWWEQKLWRMYDSTEHALNTSMVPLVAYSGEVDSQIQAAQAMILAMRSEGLELTHVVGPKTGHKYEPIAKAEVNRRIDALAVRGRDPVPHDVSFVTHTLRYPEMAWVRIDALGQHWEQARVEGWQSPHDNSVQLTTKNITALTLEMPTGLCGFDPRQVVTVELDGDTLTAPKALSDRSWKASFYRQGVSWRLGAPSEDGLRKERGLQGPIDDAFMDRFVFVKPTGTPMNQATAKWVEAEFSHATEHWRRHFRGDALIQTDQSLSEADISHGNIVLFGDPSSNSVLAKILDRLPIQWSREELIANGKTYPAGSHLPVLIFPNPLNPKHYVVLNSGFTFREYDYLNNARQTSKLPDWAVIDITQPVNARSPGRVADAGFFGERWEWKAGPKP